MRLKELHVDWKAATAIVVVVLLLIVESYHKLFSYEGYDRTLLYLGAPLLVVLLVFQEKPAEYGFWLGDWKVGLALTVGCCAAIAVAMTFVARTTPFRTYYAPLSRTDMPLLLSTGLDLLGWEFLFRGFLLFALYRACGPLAILLQAVPFTIAHIGKPELETLSCIFGGSAMGYVAWRTRSFPYPFLIHWFLATLTISLATGG